MIKETFSSQALVFGPALLKERVHSDHQTIVVYVYKNSSALKMWPFETPPFSSRCHRIRFPSLTQPVVLSYFQRAWMERKTVSFPREATGPLCTFVQSVAGTSSRTGGTKLPAQLSWHKMYGCTKTMFFFPSLQPLSHILSSCHWELFKNAECH